MKFKLLNTSNVSMFQPTTGRPWLVRPFDNIPWFMPILTLFPALLFSILVFMDQQITAVIVNRKDNKLRVMILKVSN